MSQLNNTITDLIGPTINDLGFELVKLNMRNSDSSMVLELMVEPLDGRRLSIGDCRVVSRHVSALLDVEDIIRGVYSLEVSSPGVERPLVRIKDYHRFMGSLIRVRLKSLINGTSHYKGVISKVVDEPKALIYLKTDNLGEIEVPFDNVKGAHLVITDEMFQKMMKK